MEEAPENGEELLHSAHVNKWWMGQKNLMTELPKKKFNFHSHALYILGNITLKMSAFCVFTLYYGDKTKQSLMNWSKLF